MDAWVVLAPTRWKLQAAIRAVNQVMAELRVRQHPEKTFIWRIARGFDFLGYHFLAAGLAIARQTWSGVQRTCPGFMNTVRRQATQIALVFSDRG